MSEAEFIFRSMNTHQVLLIVVDTRILGCIADSLQERRFASISTTDYKDSKSSIHRSEVIWINVLKYHGRCVQRCVGTYLYSTSLLESLWLSLNLIFLSPDLPFLASKPYIRVKYRGEGKEFVREVHFFHLLLVLITFSISTSQGTE